MRVYEARGFDEGMFEPGPYTLACVLQPVSVSGTWGMCMTQGDGLRSLHLGGSYGWNCISPSNRYAGFLIPNTSVCNLIWS